MSLDMDEASRMARAREMEFTRPVYHETTPENARSLLSGGSGFDLSMGRAGASDSEMPRGVFVKSHDRPIGVAGSHSEQIPLSIRPGNELVMQDRDALRAFLRQDEQYRALSDEIARVNAHYKQMTDDLENQYVRRMPKEDTDALLAREDALLNEWAEMEDSLSRQAQGRATEFLRGGGYDSLRVAQDAGSWGRSTDTTVVLDPRNVRSRFAAFDPAKRDSSDLLASMAPIGLGSIGALQLIGSEQRD